MRIGDETRTVPGREFILLLCNIDIDVRENSKFFLVVNALAVVSSIHFIKRKYNYNILTDRNFY